MKSLTHVPNTKEPGACLDQEGKMIKEHADIVTQGGAYMIKLLDAKNRTANSFIPQLG